MAALRSRLAISQLIVFLLIGNKQVDAQNGNGCISGSVVDSKHNGVSGATVKAQGISGSEREPTRTKSDGSFILADIRTGKISVTAFKKLDEENYWFGKAATWPIEVFDTSCREWPPQPVGQIALTERRRFPSPSIAPPANGLLIKVFQITSRPVDFTHDGMAKGLVKSVLGHKPTRILHASSSQRSDPATNLGSCIGPLTFQIRSARSSKVVVVLTEAESGTLIKRFVASDNKPIVVEIPRPGEFQVTFLTDRHEPLHLLAVKKAPSVSGQDRILVFTTDGTLLIADNQCLFTISMREEKDENGTFLQWTSRSIEATHRYYFTPETFLSLPLPGIRSLDNLALLLPGVFPAPETTNPSGPGLGPGIGTSGQFSANGIRSRSNNFTVDGSDNNEEDVGVRRQGFVSPMPQTMESVQEYQVITLLGDARYGRNIGAQVNSLSSTGSPFLHGSLYGLLNNGHLNARDFFDGVANGQPQMLPVLRPGDNSPVYLDQLPLFVDNAVRDKDSFTRSQAGFALGGPWYNRRSFFFVSAERQDIHASKESHFAVPTVKQRGIFDTGDRGIVLQDTGQRFPSTEIGSAIFSLFPFPNNPFGPYGSNTYTSVLPADGEGVVFLTKLDHAISGHHSIAGRYGVTSDSRTLPSVGTSIFSSLRSMVRTHNLAFFLYSNFSSMKSNVARLSFGRTKVAFADPYRDSEGDLHHPFLLDSTNYQLDKQERQFLLNAPLLMNTTLPLPPGGVPSIRFSRNLASRCDYLSDCSMGDHFLFKETEQLTGPLGQVIIAGFSPVGVDVFNFPQNRTNNSFQYADLFTNVRYRHLISAGVDIRRTHIDSVVDRNTRPLVTFNGLRNPKPDASLPISLPDGSPLPQQIFSGATLAGAGVPTGMFQTLAVNPHPTVHLRSNQLNFFVQDEVRLNSKIQFMLGIRYELNTVPKTVGNQLEAAFDRGIRFAEEAQKDQSLCGNIQTRCDQLASTFRDLPFRVAFGSDRNNVAPRVGFAWKPSSTREWVVRGGYGLYYDNFLGTVINQSRNAFSDFIPLNTATLRAVYLYNLSNPILRDIVALDLEGEAAQDIKNLVKRGTLNTLSSSPGRTLNPVSSFLRTTLHTPPFRETSSPIFPALDLMLPSPSLQSPYAHHFSLVVGGHFADKFSLSIAYAGTRGTKLIRVSTPDSGFNRSLFEFDALLPIISYGFSPRGDLFPPSKTFDNFTVARSFFESSASSTFHSLQALLTMKLSSAFQLSSAFTYSRVIDDASDIFDTAGSFALPQDSARRSERGPSSFDASFREVSHFVWKTSGKEAGNWRRSFFRSWQLSGILSLQSGQPYTVNSAIDVNRDGNITDRLNTTSGLAIDPGSDRRVQLSLLPGVNPTDLLAPDRISGAVGRNTFRSRGIAAVDVAMEKELSFGGASRKLFLRMEAFNLFNRTHFGIPVRILEFPSFGQSIRTSVPPRSLQAVLRFAF